MLDDRFYLQRQCQEVSIAELGLKPEEWQQFQLLEATLELEAPSRGGVIAFSECLNARENGAEFLFTAIAVPLHEGVEGEKRGEELSEERAFGSSRPGAVEGTAIAQKFLSVCLWNALWVVTPLLIELSSHCLQRFHTHLRFKVRRKL